MSDISRKALEEAINTAYHNKTDVAQIRVEVLRRILSSTESEGEAREYKEIADQYAKDIQEAHRKWLAITTENERLRAALDLIKRNEMFEHMTKTSTWKIADEALSSHREDAKNLTEGYSLPVRCPRCNSQLLGNQLGGLWCSNVGGHGEAACDFGIKDGRDGT